MRRPRPTTRRPSPPLSPTESACAAHCRKAAWRGAAGALADARLQDALERRFEAWRQTRPTRVSSPRARRAEQAKTQQRATRDGHAAAVSTRRSTPPNRRSPTAMSRRRAVTSARSTSLAAQAGSTRRQRARSGALHAELARLKGWQQWGGAVARDELVAQAEALAAEDAAASTTLPVKQRAERIASLRARWKELDRLGSAGSAAAWRRFDEALTTAHRPVAEHAAAQRAAREQNLRTRLELLDVLDAVRLPGEAADDGVAGGGGQVADAPEHAETSLASNVGSEPPSSSSSAADAASRGDLCGRRAGGRRGERAG